MLISPAMSGALSEAGLATFQSASTADVAEVTLCFLMHRQTKTAHNAFTVIRFLRDPLHSSLQGSLNLTTRPELVASQRDFQFAAKRIYMRAADAVTAVTGMVDTLRLTNSHGVVEVESPGTWHSPIAIGSGEHHTSDFVPGGRFRWQIERWAANEGAIVGLATKTRLDVWARIQRALGCPVPYERLGNILVAVESATSLHLVASDDARTLGVRILGDRPDAATAVIELSYADEGRSIMTHVLTDEFSTLRVAGPAEKCTVSLFGSSGTLVARKSRDLSPRRDIKLYGETFVFDHESRHVEVALPNAANPVGAYVSWQPRKSRPRDSVHDWDLEVQYAPVRRAQATLLAHKKFILYTGGTKERQRAMADIREFLNQYGTDSVRIWDPYFEARDLIEFLTAVNNSNADIRVLTNRRKQKGHDDLDAVKLWLKNPGPGVPPATSVSVRFFVGPSHDRFLLCGDKCWQLGSSLNHIGAKISTIVELPVSKPVWSAFEYAWERSKSW